MLLLGGTDMQKSERDITTADLKALVRDLYARAQAAGRAGDFAKAWEVAGLADGLAAKLEAVPS